MLNWPLISSLLVVAGFSITKISDYDIWWHLNLGRAVANQRWPVVSDTFSWTYAGATQSNGEWLADLSWYGAYFFGGYLGVAVLKAILLVSAFIMLWKGASSFHHELCLKFPNAVGPALLFSFALLACAIRFRMFPRPYLFSFLFLAVFLFVLAEYRRTGAYRLLLILPVIEVLWANTSKGAFWGPFLIGLACLEPLLKRRLDYRLSITFLVVICTSLLNPDWFKLYELPLALVTGGGSGLL